MTKPTTELKNKRAESLRQILQREFVKRCQKNSAYSMRAFAKFLDVDQSFLSKLMRGQRFVSDETAASLMGKIGLNPSQYIIDGNLQQNDNFLPLMDDEFSAISEWYHFAILELSKTKGFRPEPSTIAKRLDIHPEEARSAIERLRRLGLIRFEEGNFSVNSSNNTWTNTKTTSDARKHLQKRLLERGIEAVETIPFDLRENGSLTIAIDKSRIPEFKEKLKQIRQELGDFFQAGSKPDEVYQLTMAFFPLTRIEIEGTSK